MWIHRPPTNHERALQPQQGGKWLTLRTRPRIDYIKRIKAATRWAIWIPTAIMMIALLFFPETWAVVSHLSTRVPAGY
jgi:hypothetical protein